VYNLAIETEGINSNMKLALQVLCIMFFLAGLTFLLQGINVLPGSYMTGDPQWAINGGVMMAITAGLFVWINRRK
jgi:hypothetical protein